MPRPGLAPCLLAVAAGCGGLAPSPVPSPAATVEARRQQDVDYLAAELVRLHPNLFFLTPRADFDRLVADVRRAAPSASDHEARVGLMRIPALVGDGHTALYAWEEFPKIPLRFARLPTGLYVVSAEAPLASALGARVLSFDATGVEEAERRAAAVISHDNAAGLRDQLPRYLILPQVLHALGVTGDPSALTLLLEDESGARFPTRVSGAWSTAALLDVTAVSGRERPLFRQRPQENYWFTELEGSRTVYFQYNRCQDAAESFASVSRRLFTLLDGGGVDRLVVDVRLNAGGDSSVDDPLVEGLRERRAWRTRPRLSVLVGGATFSSGLWAADDLRKLGGVLIGEPTGGKPNHYGNVRTFTLPNSRLTVGYSTRYYRLLADSDPPSLAPEILVEPTIEDLRRGRDRVLEAAVSLRP